ncbi:uncharacterized protein HD556DRAFT_1309407 [Suillus plorans]|uniref:Uncharacterized protein n=1 Tax=Suillus plorans TaxID=116603 RepID=A0A9P7AMC6_9AGAM|nr:uncharacterized protein HD556DRAFT_1309407 [Suillus plorans]KAG1792340.1 hypothetical protein HD556DRAFT_1309407 [Suillus plorans]
MAPVATPTTDFITAPNTVYDIIAQAIDRAFSQDIRNLTRTILECKPRGSVIVVNLTEHEDDMATVWPMLSAQQAYKESNVTHINHLSVSSGLRKSVLFLVSTREFIANPADGATPRSDVESGKLQIRGPIVLVSYYNNVEATSSSFVEGAWYHSTMLASSKIASCALAVASGHHHHSWCLYVIPVLETNVQTVEGITHSFLAAAPHRAPGQETEGFDHHYLLADFRPRRSRCLQKLFATHRALRDIYGKALAEIYVGVFDLAKRGVSASYRFFEFSRASIDVNKLKREGEAHFDLPEISTMQIIKHPFVSNLASYVNALPSKDSQTEEQDNETVPREDVLGWRRGHRDGGDLEFQPCLVRDGTFKFLKLVILTSSSQPILISIMNASVPSHPLAHNMLSEHINTWTRKAEGKDRLTQEPHWKSSPSAVKIQQFLQEQAVYDIMVPLGPQKYPKSSSLFQPLMPVEHPTVSVDNCKLQECSPGEPQGSFMGVITKSSDAIAMPAIAATEMIIVHPIAFTDALRESFWYGDVADASTDHMHLTPYNQANYDIIVKRCYEWDLVGYACDKI